MHLLFDYKDPFGNHATVVPGGKDAVDSPQSRNTNLGNDNSHDGLWLQTFTQKPNVPGGEKIYIFIPRGTTIMENKPGTSILWHDFVIQEPDGNRFNYAPASLMLVLKNGIVAPN